MVRAQPDPPDSPEEGGLAQLGEHLLCKQGVVGSIPSSSTNFSREKKLETNALIEEDLFLVFTRLFFNKMEEVKRIHTV